MKIERIQIKIRDLIDGYEEKGAEGIEGVVAYGGKLDVRPAYQREYIYGEKDRDEVLRSVKKHFPINIMYWAKIDNGRYEVMDGQQRTISICRYAAAKDPKNLRFFEQCFAVDDLYFFNLASDIQNSILDYELDIYVCDGEPSEILAWFKVINIAGKVLSEQELRNTSYTGSWLSDAKVKPGTATVHTFNPMQPEPVGSIENRIIYIKHIALSISLIDMPQQLKAVDPAVLFNCSVGLIASTATPSAHVDTSCDKIKGRTSTACTPLLPYCVKPLPQAGPGSRWR